jgi:hypothetical protein
MAQRLRVLQDPSIVDNVPTTPLEQLQLATEQKAAQMAAARNGAQPTAARPTVAQLQALRTVANALQAPISHHAIDTQERLTGTPSPMLAFAGDQGTGSTAPGVAAIDGAMMPPGPRPDPRGYFLRGDPGQTDWSVANSDNGQFGIPAQGFATQPNGPPIMRAAAAPPPPPVMVAPPPNVTRSVNRFLSEQGQNTNGMTEGERANALKKAMGIGGP